MDKKPAASTPEVQIVISRVWVSLLPEEDRDYQHFKISLESRGKDRWAVCWGSMCLSNGGKWDYEPMPSSRTPSYLARHRFSLDEAKTLATKMAPKITVNGTTALQLWERRNQPE